jgi:hypothetical protein
MQRLVDVSHKVQNPSQDNRPLLLLSATLQCATHRKGAEEIEPFDGVHFRNFNIFTVFVCTTRDSFPKEVDEMPVSTMKSRTRTCILFPWPYYVRPRTDQHEELTLTIIKGP